MVAVGQGPIGLTYTRLLTLAGLRVLAAVFGAKWTGLGRLRMFWVSQEKGAS